jgi:hypothetical protein
VQTAGDPTFITLDDWDHDADTDIVYGTIKSPSAGLRVRLNTGAWATWSETTLPRPSNFGEYQGEAIGDLDGDGLRDVVATASSADNAISGVVWLRAPNWDRGEISGVPGSKYDNVVLDDIDGDGDLDVVTSEQNGNSNADPSGRLGVVWYENPLVP